MEWRLTKPEMVAGLHDSTVQEFSLQTEPKKGFNGWMEEIALADLLQLVCLEGAERELVIQVADQEGRIFFSGGEIVHAICSGAKGQDAFYDIMAWQSGTFMLRRGTSTSKTIDVPWNFLIMEALKRSDEKHTSAVKEKQCPLKVIVVDDSKVICRALREIFRKEFDLEIVGEASNGAEALEMIESQKPDLLTLDINMPVMGGDLALKHIMIKSPCPVVLMSGFNPGTFSRIMEFLRLGAVDFVPKPMAGDDWQKVIKRLSRSVDHANELKINNIRRARAPKSAGSKLRPGLPATQLLVILGGAGGLLEFQKILPILSQHESLAMLVLQDMAAEMVDSLAGYVDNFSHNTVSACKSGSPLLSSQCWIDNWDASLEVMPGQNGAVSSLFKTPDGVIDANRLLTSAASAFGSGLVVLVFSGTDLEMESGLKEVVLRNGRILVQEPETCLYPGPLKQLLALELEAGCFEPDKVVDAIDALNL